MTGAEALSRLEARGARVLLLPDEKIDITAPAGPETDLLIDELAAHKPEAVAVLRARPPVRPCCDCETAAADELTLFCPSCWTLRQEARQGRLLAFDEGRLRRHEERRQRTAAALAERYCSACGFSFWRVSPRGDASCEGCRLMAEGKPLRCARCGGEEWRRDSAGRRACATCTRGDTRGPAPVEIARPGETSREFPAPRGASR